MTHLALSLIALFSTAVHAVNGQCKPRPGSSGWPSDQDWQTLNQTINGKLLAPLPPAIVCDSARPEFNNASCTDLIVSTKWFNSSFHADHPSSVDWPNWQNDGCIPPIFTKNVSTPCDTTAFPAYVVAAESGDDVAAAVKFAAKSGVRLVVKATGHDFLGRQVMGRTFRNETLSLTRSRLGPLRLEHFQSILRAYEGSKYTNLSPRAHALKLAGFQQ